MGFNTNTTNRLPAITPIGTFFVFDISVLPAPSGNVIDLEPGNYIISETIDFGINTIRFDHVGEELSIRTIDKGRSKLTCSSTGTFLDVVNALNVNISNMDVTLSGAGAKFMNMVGVTNTFTPSAVTVSYTGGGTTEIGLIDGGTVNANGFVHRGFRNGLTLTNIQAVNYVASFLLSDFAGTGAIFTINNLGVAGGFNNTGIVAGASQSAFDIDPTINPALQLIIDQVQNQGLSTYFKAGMIKAITLFADASITATAITSVSSGTSIPAGGNYARFNHAGTDVFVGQRVVNSTFTPEVTYNQTLIVTVTGAGFFEGNIESTGAPIAFTSSDTGSYLSNSVTVTSAAHGFSALQTLLILKTIAYNAGYTIYNPLTNTFQVNATFATGETSGELDTGSLTEKDSRLNVTDCGNQKDSLTVGGWTAVSNVTATDVLDGTYVDIDLGTATPLSFNERISLIDPVNGALRYDGLDPEVLQIPIEFLVTPVGGGTRTYNFKIVIDRGAGFVDLADIIETQEQYSGSGDDRTFKTSRSVLMNQGDIVKYQAEGVGTTADFTATQGCTSI